MFELQVAWRFLREGRMQTALILVGIAIGIAVLIFLNTLISGLQEDLVASTVGNSPHLRGSALEPEPPARVSDRYPETTVITTTVSPAPEDAILRNWEPVWDQLETMDMFAGITPAVNGSGFVVQGDRALPVAVRGFPPEDADGIYDIDARMVAGEFAADGNRLMLGVDLAESLQATPGSVVRLTTPDGIDRSFSVAGVFDLGSQAINESWVVLDLGAAQTLYGLEGGIEEIELQLDDVFAAEEAARSLERAFPDLEWTSWQEENADLLSALRSQSSSSYVIQAFVLLAVTMGISSVLAVSVIQKSRQIGILKALGSTTTRVSRIFLLQGAMLGLAGAGAGALLGSSLVWAFFAFVRDDVGEPLFPVSIGPGIILAAVALATLAGMGAAVAPARRAAGLNTIEVIKDG